MIITAGSRAADIHTRLHEMLFKREARERSKAEKKFELERKKKKEARLAEINKRNLIIAGKFDNGDSPQELAAEYHTTDTNIRKILRDLGRSPANRRSDERD